jgi:hypothetical protein
MIKLRITTDGRICGLWTDAVPMQDIGPVHVRRASHVEFDDRQQRWCVRTAAPRSLLQRLLRWLPGQTPGTVLHRAATRGEALAWEREHFQPGGPGWRQLAG